MAKLLGRPVNTAGAQLRLMVPIAMISAFLNNTPVVVIMIPICQKWGKNVGISAAQLLVPLSFSSILGGTCTLIGTSTNLVVAGLLAEYDPSIQIGLFDLGEFGVPIALIGISYIIIAAPYLLPGGKHQCGRRDTALPVDDGTILLGARLTKWSPAAGRTVKRSGLRDTGGVYLVSVYRARSGNIHRAVGQDFVLNVDDILYFTGMVDGFGQFCENHGLEVITNEVDITVKRSMQKKLSNGSAPSVMQRKNSNGSSAPQERQRMVKFASSVQIPDNDFDAGAVDMETPPLTIETKSVRSSFFNQEEEHLQAINRLTDMIRGYNPSEPFFPSDDMHQESMLGGPTKVIVVIDTQELEDVVLVGINSIDRPGLLLTISRGLHSLGLQLHHTEASVISGRSISIWRCALIDDDTHPDAADMQAVLSSMLEKEGGAGVAKRRGLSVIRCVVTDESRLIDKTLDEIDFREEYKAAIIAVQKKDKSKVDNLTEVCFAPGDILILQANDDSPLLVTPPPDFYSSRSSTSTGYTRAARDTIFKAVGGLKLSSSSNDLKGKDTEEVADDISMGSTETRIMDTWKDLRVLFYGKEGNARSQEGGGTREFLAAVTVSAKSEHIGRTVAQSGLDRQSGLFLVGVERPVSGKQSIRVSFAQPSIMPRHTSPFDAGGVSLTDGNGSEMASITQNMPTASIPVPPEGHLKEGDILW